MAILRTARWRQARWTYSLAGQMKKNRPGQLVTVLCESSEGER